ncbi:MAG: sensor histidine kinase [Chloroflexota bacterium]
MLAQRLRHLGLYRQRALVAVVVVASSYLVNLILPLGRREYPFTILELAEAVLLGAAYLAFFIWEDAYFARFGTRLGTAVYFLLLVGLCLLLQIEFSASGLALISLPLVGVAEVRLRQRWRWFIYLAAFYSITLPLVDFFDWDFAIGIAFLYSPAYVLMVVFVRLLENERQARQQAEHLTAELETANHQLSAFAAQAQETAVTQERNRLAREIHDNLGHYLTVVHVQIEAARAVMSSDRQLATNALNVAQELTQEGLAAVRQSVMALRESPLGNKSLPEAITALVSEVQQTGLTTKFEVKGSPRFLEARTALTLFRAAQEGLTNVRKHANALQVEVRLDYTDPAAVSLAVSDDGVGSEVEATTDGFGLLGVRERVKLLGGRVIIDSAPGRGFRLAVEIPG